MYRRPKNASQSKNLQECMSMIGEIIYLRKQYEMKCEKCMYMVKDHLL